MKVQNWQKVAQQQSSSQQQTFASAILFVWRIFLRTCMMMRHEAMLNRNVKMPATAARVVGRNAATG